MNCWWKSGILSVTEEEKDEPADDIEEMDQELWRQICENNNTPTDVKPEDFIDIDSAVTVEKEMSDVSQGGATVFPQINVALRPEKGAAAFWYNLHPSGEGDMDTRHAACPVLTGSKWEADEKENSLKLQNKYERIAMLLEADYVKRLLVSVLLCECFIDRFNMSEKKDKSYTRKFRKEWLSDERVKDWLLEVPGDPSIARCKYCQCSLNVRLSDLLDHGRTKKHLKASEQFSTSHQSKLQFIPVKHTYECAAAEAALSLFVINHCSVRSVDHLSDLTKRFFKGADHASLLRLHRTKCSGLIRNILFQHFKSELQSDIDSGHFSLLIDESTDISVIKLLAVCIVYYSKQQHTIVSTFLGIVELEQGNADCIVSAIKSLLSDYGLDIKHMRGVGTDNASVMVGINNGVCQKLKQEVSNLVLIPCVCHSVQLAVSFAAEMLPRNIEFLISETYSWFSKSSSRQITYRLLFQAINDGAEPLKIVQQSNTRWLSIEVAVNRILNQWLELQIHFETSRLQNKCYAAELLYGMYCDVINKLYLVFLIPYLEECQKVKKSFQSSTADPSKLLKDLILLIVGITRRIVPGYREDLLTVEVRKYKSPNIYLGHEVEILLTDLKKDTKISPDNEKVFRNRCENFLFCLADELQRRLARDG
ncbi:hypothetical protein ANN_14256 [Periplaneta americana]|uniref:DUF4371 domain-containing protein n=1 Tax=Periplaneta americana TaxID=6978 RepID=A0ABQ8SVT1_PERAM|nr:hypothetical protein ANN_14256 [Periplaneta americana]